MPVFALLRQKRKATHQSHVFLFLQRNHRNGLQHLARWAYFRTVYNHLYFVKFKVYFIISIQFLEFLVYKNDVEYRDNVVKNFDLAFSAGHEHWLFSPSAQPECRVVSGCWRNFTNAPLNTSKSIRCHTPEAIFTLCRCQSPMKADPEMPPCDALLLEKMKNGSVPIQVNFYLFNM